MPEIPGVSEHRVLFASDLEREGALGLVNLQNPPETFHSSPEYATQYASLLADPRVLPM